MHLENRNHCPGKSPKRNKKNTWVWETERINWNRCSLVIHLNSCAKRFHFHKISFDMSSLPSHTHTPFRGMDDFDGNAIVACILCSSQLTLFSEMIWYIDTRQSKEKRQELRGGKVAGTWKWKRERWRLLRLWMHIISIPFTYRLQFIYSLLREEFLHTEIFLFCATISFEVHRRLKVEPLNMSYAEPISTQWKGICNILHTFYKIENCYFIYISPDIHNKIVEFLLPRAQIKNG